MIAFSCQCAYKKSARPKWQFPPCHSVASRHPQFRRKLVVLVLRFLADVTVRHKGIVVFTDVFEGGGFAEVGNIPVFAQHLPVERPWRSPP